MASEPLNVLVVSHAAVIPINQEPFDALAGAGARVTLVAPRVLPTDLRGVPFRKGDLVEWSVPALLPDAPSSGSQGLLVWPKSGWTAP